jgi:hypothetical protein
MSSERARDAIVFVPGFPSSLTAGSDQSADGIASRIAVALSRLTPGGTTEFVLLAGGREESFAGKHKAQVRTVARRDGTKDNPVVDLYTLDYSDDLVRKHEQSGLPKKILDVSVTLIAYLPRSVGSLFRSSGKTFGEKVQLLYTSGIGMLLCVYLVMLLVAAFGAIQGLLPQDSRLIADGEQVWLFVKGLAIVQGITVLGTMAMVAWPKLPQAVSQMASRYLSAANYIRREEDKAEMTGPLADLISLVKRNGHTRIHVVAYSFGTVIALDTLFTSQKRPGTRTDVVNTLVTIGCPFDLIRTYQREYFARPAEVIPTSIKWVNVYSPQDLLGSNFRNDGDTADPQQGIGVTDPKKRLIQPTKSIPYPGGETATDYGLLGGIMLLGLRMHTVYWGSPSSDSCFRDFLPELEIGAPPPEPPPPTAQPAGTKEPAHA